MKNNKLIFIVQLIIFLLILMSCKDKTIEDTKTPIETFPTEETGKTPTNDSSNKEETKVEVPKTIIIYFDIDWENISDVYFNDVQMEYGPYDNGSEFRIEVEAESITKFDLDFKQHNYSWWHVQDSYQSWNCDSYIEVNMKAGETYIVKDVNWTYQWDNEEQKWYTCTINKQ